MKIACPACQHVHELADGVSVSRLRCRGCGELFEPHAEAPRTSERPARLLRPVEDDEDDDDYDRPRRKAPRKRKLSNEEQWENSRLYKWMYFGVAMFIGCMGALAAYDSYSDLSALESGEVKQLEVDNRTAKIYNVGGKWAVVGLFSLMSLAGFAWAVYQATKQLPPGDEEEERKPRKRRRSQ